MAAGAKRSPPRSPGAGSVGSAAASAATLQPQVVRVVLPNEPSSGEHFECRFASLDLDAAVLRLNEVDIPEDEDNGRPTLGRQTVLKLASIADGASSDGTALILRAGGQKGKTLLELHFQQAATAKAWEQQLRDYRTDDGQRANQTLRQLIAQQEEQVRLLETINEKKGEQLEQLQAQLQRALEGLTKFQATYAGQQTLLDEQAETIEELKRFAAGAGNALAACERNAAEAAAGRAAAAASRRAAAEEANKAKAAKASPKAAGAAKAAAAKAPAAPPAKASQPAAPAPPAVAEEDEDDEEIGDVGPEQLKAMLEQLAALEAQKSMFEALLRQEQSGVATDLSDIQSLLAAPGAKK
eukprot:TRINITY_DN27355_c0_g1_i1.p1 TRINITY_DN27355_c0_g1~~TRINITY_DN27355_c0_g1_i1.p1  ORF type:complete len:355 (-),score=159.68 TRINITY_DN27355_c0_g1_i1:57-1121(-)